MPFNKNIILCGFMASGKTTVGAKLAKKKKIKFLDIDNMLEKKYKQNISQIFKDLGEKTFRKYETEMLKDIYTANYEQTVIACGGGIILENRNIVYLNQIGKIYFLKCNFEVILNRLLKDEDEIKKRPLIRKRNFKNLKDLFENRNEIYIKHADFIIDANHSTEKIISEILNKAARSYL